MRSSHNARTAAVSGSQISLSWNDNSSSESGFKIERSTDNFITATEIVVAANVTNYSDTGLHAGTTCSYRVRAYTATVASDYSNTATATTPSATAPVIVQSGVILPPHSMVLSRARSVLIRCRFQLTCKCPEVHHGVERAVFLWQLSSCQSGPAIRYQHY